MVIDLIRVASSRAEIAALWESHGPFSDDIRALADARLIEIERKCSMCDRPAFVTKTGRVQRYCTTQGCGNPVRLCQYPGCGREFMAGQDGAGRRRCADHLTTHGGSNRFPSLVTHACARCGKQGRGSDRLWPYVCQECRHPLRFAVTSLRNHHVPWEMAVRLFDNPGCDICGANILGQTRHAGMAERSDLCVDHDHSCCPGSTSCGKCVRGFLCTHCNKGIGHFSDEPARVRAAADYLDRWRRG
jgi:Recombination endonuclease VII.